MARATLVANGSVEERADSLFNGGYSISAKGTWGSGTLSFTATSDGTNYFPIGSIKLSDRSTVVTSITADDFVYGDAVGLKSIKATLAGATSPSLDISVTAKPA